MYLCHWNRTLQNTMNTEYNLMRECFKTVGDRYYCAQPFVNLARLDFRWRTRMYASCCSWCPRCCSRTRSRCWKATWCRSRIRCNVRTRSTSPVRRASDTGRTTVDVTTYWGRSGALHISHLLDSSRRTTPTVNMTCQNKVYWELCTYMVGQLKWGQLTFLIVTNFVIINT